MMIVLCSAVLLSLALWSIWCLDNSGECVYSAPWLKTVIRTAVHVVSDVERQAGRLHCGRQTLGLEGRLPQL